MKKLISIVTIISMLLCFNIQAKSLGDLKNELNNMEKDLEKNEQEKELTEKQIADTEDKVVQIKNDINKTYEDINNLTEEIKTLDKDIKSKDKEIKEILSFIQVSNGESAYMEYLLGAKDFTEFIYRLVVSEQMTNYNDNLIDDYHKMINDNKEKKVELGKKEKELKSKQSDLEQELSKLGDKLSEISDTSISMEDEIEAQKEIISMYENMGCSDNQDIASCGRRVLSNLYSEYGIVSSGAFHRPLDSGYVTSEWGNRALFDGFHEGIDQSNTTSHIPVYSVGTGIVASIMPQSSCGGNMVVAHYNVGGQDYTVVYAHLYTINVSSGQILTPNTQIGTMGGGSDTTWYDGCTLGDHLHISISTGLYGIDYWSWDTLVSRSMDPRYMIDYPAGQYNWWYGR